MCDHLYETTSRYETATKILTFLLVCPVCRVEEVVETLEYEPNFVPRVTGITGRRRRLSHHEPTQASTA